MKFDNILLVYNALMYIRSRLRQLHVILQDFFNWVMALDLCKNCVFMKVLCMFWYILDCPKIEILEIIFYFSVIFFRVTASKLF